MNVNHFLQTLPDQFNDWGKESVHPKDDSGFRVTEGAWIMGSRNTVSLIRYAVSLMEPDEVYLEMGVLQGGTFVPVIHGNKAKAWAVDNWSDFDENGKNRRIFIDRLEKYGLSDRTTLYEMDSLSFLRNQPLGRVGVCFYDAEHDFWSTVKCLLGITRILSDNALIIVDDYGFKSPPRAIKALLRHCKNLELSMVLQGQSQTSWWNGLALLEYKR